jgi:hypothetical protein
MQNEMTNKEQDQSFMVHQTTPKSSTVGTQILTDILAPITEN